MAAVSIVENLVNQVIDKMKSELPLFLAEVRQERDDGKVTTEPPVSYFIYENPIAYKTPAIIVIADNVDYRLGFGQNMINAKVTLYISCIVEDRKQELLTIKIYRYHDAIYKCLNRAHLINDNPVQQNIIKIVNSNFSPIGEKKVGTESIFRKEVLFTMDIEHYEGEN